jgi:hypothetical protein
MEAHLYIIPESFQNNTDFSINEIEDKVKRLAEDIRIINKYSNSNKLFTDFASIYPVIFHSTFTIEDFICRPRDVKKVIDRDVVDSIQNIFQKANDAAFSSEEIIEVLLPLHDETTCHGLIAFHTVDNVPDEVQLIYGIDSWYKFRRHFLGLYPDMETFIDECFIYYPNLFFHKRNKVQVHEILNDFSKSILKHLAVLNDTFFYYKDKTFDNESIKYQTLTSECNLEADAASKDTNDAKDKLSFTFIDKNNKEKKITCYPHLRLCRSDNYPGDSSYYQHRIYFHEGVNTVLDEYKKEKVCEIQDGKILIGHIGRHL